NRNPDKRVRRSRRGQVQSKRRIVATACSEEERSAARRRDQYPIRIAGMGIACKSPEIGLFDRLIWVTVDDAAIMRAQAIQLIRDQLHRDSRHASVEHGVDDVQVLDLDNARL